MIPCYYLLFIGIEAQTLANFQLAKQAKLAIIPVVSKMDLPTAQPEEVMDQLWNGACAPVPC